MNQDRECSKENKSKKKKKERGGLERKALSSLSVRVGVEVVLAASFASRLEAIVRRKCYGTVERMSQLMLTGAR